MTTFPEILALAEPGREQVLSVEDWAEIRRLRRADYLACYAGDRFAESIRYVRRYPEELPVLAGLLPRITAPVTIVNGRHDRVVPLPNAEFLDQRLPTSRLVIIDAGHFAWEEQPARYAAAVIDSVSGNWPGKE